LQFVYRLRQRPRNCDYDPGKSRPPANVTATKTTDGNYVIVTWDAVDGASGYMVYMQQAGKKSVSLIGSGGNSPMYALADGALSENTDIDKWYNRVTVVKVAPGAWTSKSYRFGVRSSAMNSNTAASDIVWSGNVGPF
jgi:hypothetical protein